MEELLDYAPYGSERLSWSATSESGESDSLKTFIGEYSDRESGLSYLNARYYDGEVGRFTSQDAVFLSMGSGSDKRESVALLDPQSQNSYSYARNNPIRLLDNSGMFWDELGAGIRSGTRSLYDFLGSVTPGFSDARDAVGAIGGYDIITGESLGTVDRFIYGGSLLIPVSGSLIKKIIGGTNIPNVIVKQFGKSIYNGAVDLTDTLRAIERGELGPRMENNAVKFYRNEELHPGLDFSDGNQYIEYNVINSGAPGNSAERVIIGNVKGDVHYSPDHYESLTKVE